MNLKIVYVDMKILYNNRHLFTDDVQYNSLVLSNLTNQTLHLVSVKTFEYMSFSEKNELFQSQSFISISFIQKKGLIRFILIKYTQEYRKFSNRYIAWYEIPLEYEHVSLLIRDN